MGGKRMNTISSNNGSDYENEVTMTRKSNLILRNGYAIDFIPGTVAERFNKDKTLQQQRREKWNKIKPWTCEDGTIAENLTDFALGNHIGYLIHSNNGYVIAPQKILCCYRLNELEKDLLLLLASYMGNSSKVAFPSHETLAFKLGKKSATSIKTALGTLKTYKFIDWESGSSTSQSNRYFLMDLNMNALIILSETVQFVRDIIVKCYGNKISIEVLDSTILKFIETSRDKWFSEEDIFGDYIKKLQDNIGVIYTNFMFNFYGDFIESIEKTFDEVNLDNVNVIWEDVLYDLIYIKNNENALGKTE